MVLYPLGQRGYDPERVGAAAVQLVYRRQPEII